MTRVTVRRLIRTFARTDFRMWTDESIQPRCRDKIALNSLMVNECGAWSKWPTIRPVQIIGFRGRKSEADSNNRKPADVAKQADIAVFLPALAATEVDTPPPADGKVVA